MRALRLAVLALEAEGLHMRMAARRLGRRAALGAVAAVAAIACYAVLHVLAWHALANSLEPVPRAAVLAGFDAVLAIILAWIASRDTETQAEREARAVRDVALSGASHALLPAGWTQAIAVGRVLAAMAGSRIQR